MLAEGSADGAVVFVFGLVPAALLLLAALAMQRAATSLTQYCRQPGGTAPGSPQRSAALTWSQQRSIAYRFSRLQTHDGDRASARVPCGNRERNQGGQPAFLP